MKVSPAIIVVFLQLVFASASADDAETLRNLKTVLWPQAYRTQDVGLLDRLLHESFVVIDDEGKTSTKNDELEYVRDNAWNPGTFEYRIERLEVFDSGFAIVSGKGVAEKYSYTSSNVLIKEDGRWRAVSSHVSGVKSRGQSQVPEK